MLKDFDICNITAIVNINHYMTALRPGPAAGIGGYVTQEVPASQIQFEWQFNEMDSMKGFNEWFQWRHSKALNEGMQ